VSDKLRLVAGSQENHGLSPAPMKEKILSIAALVSQKGVFKSWQP